MTGSREPQWVTDTDWFYEYPTHMLLVHEVKDMTGRHIRTDTIKLYWRKIEQSLARVRAPKRKTHTVRRALEPKS